jgi:cytochrome c oxidase subunit 2
MTPDPILSWLGLPVAASAHAAEVDHIVGLVHWLMLVLLVGWGLFFVYVLFRFRQGKQKRAIYHGVKGRWSTWVEGGVLAAEIVLLVFFSIPFWSTNVDALPSEHQSTVVRVVAEQFAWNVHYPGPDGMFGRTAPDLVSSDNPIGLDRNDPAAKDDITTINRMNLPIGKPVIVLLSSKDVVHSFGLPQMRVKQDAVPGLVQPVSFTPTMLGRWDIACSQLCGLAHFRMKGIYEIQSPADFEAWLKEEAAETQASAGAGAGAGAGAASQSQPAAQTAALRPGTVTGQVRFEGTPPTPRPIRMEKDDPLCMPEKGTVSETLLVAPDGGVRYAFVYVKEGLAGKTFPAPTAPVPLDQKGCVYTPHVFGVQAGQPVFITNSDPVVHNVNATASANTPFNLIQPRGVPGRTRTFDKPEIMVPIRCDVHPWMGAWVGVVSHPFFAVSGPDGRFTIEGLPSGTYTLEVWHEELGTATQKVVLDAKGATATFSFNQTKR